MAVGRRCSFFFVLLIPSYVAVGEKALIFRAFSPFWATRVAFFTISAHFAYSQTAPKDLYAIFMTDQKVNIAAYVLALKIASVPLVAQKLKARIEFRGVVRENCG